MTSNTKLEHMELQYSMCEQEVEQLQRNLSRFLVENAPNCQHLAFAKTAMEEAMSEPNANMGDNVFALMAYDRYMSQLGAVTNLARKFNIQMQLNQANKGGVGTDVSAAYLLKDFVQWNNNLRGKEDVFDMDVKSMTATNYGNGNSLHKKQPIAIESVACHAPPSLSASPRKVHFESSLPPISHKVMPSSSIIASKDLTSFVPGYNFTATITHVVDSKQLIFYVCQMNNNELYELSNMTNLPRLTTSPKPNVIFGVSLQNKNLLRAVQKLTPDCIESKINQVLLIDFGEEVVVGDNCVMYDIPSKYQNIPAQAIKCLLLAVKTEPKAEENDRELLAAFLHKNLFVQVDLEVVLNLGNTLCVRILQDMQEHQNQHDNAPDVKDIKSEISFSKNPFITPPKTLNEEGHAPSGPMFSPVAERKMKSTTAFEKPNVMKCNKLWMSLVANEGDIVSLTVTHIASADCFYAQATDKVDQSKGPLVWSNDELRENQKLKRIPEEKELVLAQYATDEYWYRAIVLEADEEEDIFKVFYVDYGNTETVTLNCLAECMMSAETEPYRSIRCRLAGFRDDTGDDVFQSQEAVETLVVMLLNQNVRVKLVNQNKTEWNVLFIDDEFKDIPQTLAAMGYIREIKD